MASRLNHIARARTGRGQSSVRAQREARPSNPSARSIAIPRHYSIRRRNYGLSPRIGVEAMVRRMPLEPGIEISEISVSLSCSRRRLAFSTSPSIQRDPTSDCGVDGSTGRYSLRPDRPQLPCAVDLPGRFLIRDNDKIYGMKFRNRVNGLGLARPSVLIRFHPAGLLHGA